MLYARLHEKYYGWILKDIRNISDTAFQTAVPNFSCEGTERAFFAPRLGMCAHNMAGDGCAGRAGSRQLRKSSSSAKYRLWKAGSFLGKSSGDQPDASSPSSLGASGLRRGTTGDSTKWGHCKFEAF